MRSVSHAALNSSAVLVNDLSRLIASGRGSLPPPPLSYPPTVLSSDEDLLPSIGIRFERKKIQKTMLPKKSVTKKSVVPWWQNREDATVSHHCTWAIVILHAVDARNLKCWA